MALPPAGAPWHDTQPPRHELAIQFTGSGSEYFRIWIVNLLLTLVTLGIYFPWAKVRRLRYFHGNTLVGGDAMDFHGNPVKMLKGYLLVGALFAMYSLAGKFSPAAGLTALLVVVAVWPALFKSAMRFRLANTSWRGLRMRFTGNVADAYKAVVPLFVPAVFSVALLLGVADQRRPPVWYLQAMGWMGLVVLVLSPWAMWNLKRYQHSHYGFASVQTAFQATLGSFYKLALKLLGMFLLCLVVLFLGMFLVGGLAAVMNKGKAMNPMAMMGVIWGVTAVLYLGMAVVLLPYATARTQNLVWTRTSAPALQFNSTLAFTSLLWLTLKNWVLILCTLGLYWPFARVALARLRLQAVSLMLAISPDSLVSHDQAGDGEAAGDAAGDVFGLDIGF